MSSLISNQHFRQHTNMYCAERGISYRGADSRFDPVYAKPYLKSKSHTHRMVSRKNNKKNSIIKSILSIAPLFGYVCSYLDIWQIIRMRRINKEFEKLLYFKFICNNNNIYFEYNSILMVNNVLKHQICQDLKNLALFYFQFCNFYAREIFFTESKRSKKEKILNECDFVRRANMKWQYITTVQFSKKEAKWLENVDSLLSGINYKNGCCDCQVIASVYCAMSHLTGFEANETFDDDLRFRLMDIMTIASFYGIIPIAAELDRLFGNSKVFINDIQNFVPKNAIKVKNKAQYNFPNKLLHLWRRMGIIGSCFSSYTRTTANLSGKPSFLTDLAAKGNFRYFEEFVTKRDFKFKESGTVMEGILALICAFLRVDLLKKYKYCNCWDICGAKEHTCILLLSNPKYLIDLKNGLMNAMIPFNENDLFEFDIINNKRYSPQNRVKMIAKLCFSSQFALYLHGQWLRIQHESKISKFELLRSELIRLYNNFDDFCETWRLEEYNEFKNNDNKQKELHNEFRTAIQCLFGMTLFMIRLNYENEFEIRREIIEISNKSSYIDILFDNENDLKRLFNILTDNNSMDSNEFSEYLKAPKMEFEYRNEFETNEILEFESCSNPFELFVECARIANGV